MNITLKEVKLFNDNVSNLEMLKNIIDERGGGDDPLHILDLGDVLKKHRDWIKKMPRVIPYYAVKCNPNAAVIKLLAMLGGHFDCASKEEIMQVVGLGVPSERIIFANTTKFSTHVEYAKKVGVDMMTVDGESELEKIANIFPQARILIRIRCDAKIADAVLGKKFGCDATTEAVNLIKLSMQLGLNLLGFSFHTGSPCGEVDAICRGIHACNKLVHVARSFGCKTANVIDIGGGIPGSRGFDLDGYADPINVAIDTLDSFVKVIAEPGRYYVASAATAAARVIAKKVIPRGVDRALSYYLSDGVYGTFYLEFLGHEARRPVMIDATRNADEKEYCSKIWGPTCCPYDCILKDEFLPEYFVGDWLAWYDVGAYGRSFSHKFNGFNPPTVYPIMKRSDWELMCTDIANQETFW